MKLTNLTSALTAILLISASTLACRSTDPKANQNDSELEDVSKSKVVYTCLGKAERSDCSPNKKPIMEEFRLKLYSDGASSKFTKAMLYFTDSNADNTYSKVEEYAHNASVIFGAFSTKGKDSSIIKVKFDLGMAEFVSDTRHRTYIGKRGYKGAVSFDYNRKGTGTCQLVAKTASIYDPVICVRE